MMYVMVVFPIVTNNDVCCRIICMSELQSKKNRERWSKVPPEKRSEMARYAVTERWKRVSKKDRKIISQNLIQARNEKKNK